MMILGGGEKLVTGLRFEKVVVLMKSSRIYALYFQRLHRSGRRGIIRKARKRHPEEPRWLSLLLYQPLSKFSE